MPELPEVETVVRQIAPELVGRTIRGLDLHTPGMIRCQTVPVADLIVGRFVAVRRRGKFIRLDIEFRGREPITVLVHLRMTGRLFVRQGPLERDRHDHIDLLLDDGGVLRFRDMRKFGGWWLLPTNEVESVPPLSTLGPEPLEMSRDAFGQLLGQRRQRIKALLLDQRRVAGLGNIYCDESLFAARVHPETLACDIPRAKVDALWRAMRRILRKAIRRQGSTISTFTTPDGRSGGYQNEFRVYGRAGLPCPECATLLERRIVAGRGTTVCRRCQRPPRRRRQRRSK